MYRRYFLLSTAAASARTVLASSPNDTIRVGVVGVRGQGGAISCTPVHLANIS